MKGESYVPNSRINEEMYYLVQTSVSKAQKQKLYIYIYKLKLTMFEKPYSALKKEHTIGDLCARQIQPALTGQRS